MGLGRKQREVNLQQIQAEEIKSILDVMSGYDVEDYSPELIEVIKNFIKSKEYETRKMDESQELNPIYRKSRSKKA
jgi:hypothetical protein